MSAVINAIDAEITEIESDISKNPDPRQRRLDHLRAVRQLYLDDTVTTPPEPVATQSKNYVMHAQPGQFAIIDGAVPPPRSRGRRPSPERLRATAAVHTFLLDKTEPVRTGVILQHLIEQGVSVPGTEPLNNLSAMLSNDDRFASYGGRRGWILRKNEEAA